jgi:hypothetical protein
MLGGVSLTVRSTDRSCTDLVESRMRPLRCEPTGAADVLVEIRGPVGDSEWPPQPHGPGRPIYDAPAGPIDYFADADAVFVDYERRVRLLCAPGQGVIQLGMAGSDPEDRILATHPLLTMALLETMKRFGRFPLHAACLSLGGRGVLVAGASGAGKSTLSVILLRAGFDFLADDTVFLQHSPDGYLVSGFPDEMDVTANTVSMFPELRHLVDTPVPPGRDKYGFRVEDVFGIQPVLACRPAVLLSPRVEPAAPPRLVRLTPAEALFELTPNVLLTDQVASQAHLDVLAELAGSIPCFSFRMGSDLDAAARCVAELVA